MKPGRVLVSGSIAYDRIFSFPDRFRNFILPSKLHVLNVSFTVSDVRESFGGTGGNIAYSLRLLGVPVSLIGSVGDDFAAYQAWLKRHGVDLSAVRTIDNRRTAAAYMITDQDDNQIAAFQPGAMEDASLPLEQLRLAEKSAELAILSPGNTKMMVALGQRFARKKLPFIFDPGQVIPVLSRAELRLLLKLCSGFISNDYELDLTAKRSGLSPEKIRQRLPFVITTLGAKGASLTTGRTRLKIRAAVPANTIDPTGAGDAFRSGLIAGLVRGASLPLAVKMGAVASVYTVEKQGTQTHQYTLAEYTRRFRRNFSDSLPLM
ncbi:MAG: carbohydrate kinase family protein [Candidatus Kerfeldbacteria bacterium]|nr:carbohydrate kinase family protein [Candidatus Kerfeldbacteria bacterium]